MGHNKRGHRTLPQKQYLAFAPLLLYPSLMTNFDPSSIGALNGNLYGLPFTTEDAKSIVIPVPWDVTVSYRDGAVSGPHEMLNASVQVDLYDADLKDAWKLGIAMEAIPQEWLILSQKLRPKAIECIEHLAKGGSEEDAQLKPHYAEINAGCEALNAWVKERASHHLKQGKMVSVLGGEHSVSLGLIQALGEQYADKNEQFSILHVDAHADLREAYEGFKYSHASIMFNALDIPQVQNMAVVSIRDYSQQEADRIQNSQGRITAFTDLELKRAQFRGETWHDLCEKIIQPLGPKVYLSFDIDALDPALCPHTGTPVPGGLEFEQFFYLIDRLVASGRTLIGFDLSEVAPGVIQPGDIHSWDAMVGVRALYRLLNRMAQSQKA